jgi:GTP pyrophosphokinase
VDGVTKFDKAHYGQVAEAETYRKMIVLAGEDVRVLIVKLADRLHNMRTLDARSPASRARIARATQDVLVPLCERLGIQALKRDLEDCVLESLEPDAYQTIRQHVTNRPEWNAYLDRFILDAQSALRADKIPAKVWPRPRHAFSIWKDTVAGNHAIPFELPRIVVIVNGSETECYTALGAIHGRWRPVPGRFKDFVASPKNNLYRSLHTTVIGPSAQPVEVLIRTEAMHRNAEFGIIAAFRFKDVTGTDGAPAGRGRSGGRRGRVVSPNRGGSQTPRRSTVERVRSRLSPNRAEHLAWLHRVVEWQREAIDPVRFLESLRCDLAESQLHVFAGGTRLLLPEGATPIDVAYAMGDHVGERCIAATVNGRLSPISSPLEDGDVVEVHTAGPDDRTTADGEPIGPSREWLGFVRTPRAQLQITRWLDQHEEVDPEQAPPLPISAKVRIGATAIRIVLRRRERGLASDVPLHEVATGLGYPDLDALLVAVADHKLSADTVVDELIKSVDTRQLDERVAPPSGW